MKEALRGAIESSGLEMKILEQNVIHGWESYAGKAVANVSAPISIENGTLWLSVQDAAWRQELSLRRDELRKRINEKLEVELIREIILR